MPLRAHEIVADAAEIDPDVAILVPEHRRVADDTPGRTASPHNSGSPADQSRQLSAREAVLGRAEREDVDQHRLAACDPVIGQEAVLRIPAERNPIGPRLRPAPVDAGVDAIGQVADLALRRAGRNSRGRRGCRRAAARCRRWTARSSRSARRAPCRRNGRRSPCGRSCPAAPRPAAHWQGSARSRRTRAAAAGARHEPALDADRISGEREADRGHAREGGPRPAVAGQPVFGVRRSPRRSGRCAAGDRRERPRARRTALRSAGRAPPAPDRRRGRARPA